MSDGPRPDVERIEALLETALDLAPVHRASFVRQLEADDPELGAELSSLLAHTAPSEPFFVAFTAVLRAATLDVTIPDLMPLPRPDPGRRFRIDEEIGHGGMGVVYRAWDHRLERFVALKFLPPQWSADSAARSRFLAEARAAAALDHPNVCTLLEVGETDEGRGFLAMPCYEGETLAERLARGPLRAAEALNIALQIARGLAAAHRAGIVHHDVKPGNVMLTAEGRVKLLDFGIAQVLDANSPVELRAGTAAYVAPERFEGVPVDARADLWALGVVLHEMLTGERPGPIGDEGRRRREVPGGAGRVVARLLEQNADHRFQHADDVVHALERLSGGRGRRASIRAGAVLLALASTWWLMPARTPEPIDRIAVLPFQSLVEDPDLAFVVAGLQEALVEELRRVPFLTVVAVSGQGDAGRSSRGLATRLDVAGFVEGAVIPDRHGLRLDIELVSAASSDRLWRSSYRGRGVGTLPLVGAAAEDVARIALGVDELEFMTRAADLYEPPANAHAHYLKGLEALQTRSLGIIQFSSRARIMADSAIAHLERAVDAAPEWSAAWSRLALARHWRGISTEDFERSREAAEQALRLDPGDTQALASRGYVSLVHDHDWEGAGRDFEHAMALGGRHHWMYSIYLNSLGRYEEGLAAARRAQEDDPLSQELRLQVASTHACAGNHMEAYERTVQFWRDVGPGPSQEDSIRFLPLLAIRAHAVGRNDEALAWLERAFAMRRSPVADVLQGIVFARTGRTDEARAMLAWAQERDVGLLPTLMVALGDTTGAMTVMERRADEFPGRWPSFTCSNIYRSLRGYPPMEALAARKMGPLD